MLPTQVGMFARFENLMDMIYVWILEKTLGKHIWYVLRLRKEPMNEIAKFPWLVIYYLPCLSHDLPCFVRQEKQL